MPVLEDLLWGKQHLFCCIDCSNDFPCLNGGNCVNGNCSCPSGINDVKQPIRCQPGNNLDIKDRLLHGKKKVKWLWVNNVFLCILDPCSHCHSHPGVNDGPCKKSTTHGGICVNQEETHYCSTIPVWYNGPCRHTGNFEATNEMSCSTKCLRHIILISMFLKLFF